MLSITATNLPRFIKCNGSRLLEDFKSSVITDDTNREEGNAAHWLIEQVSKKLFAADELIDRKAPNGIFISGDMVENIEPYLNGEAKDGYVEYETTFRGENWEILCRADRVKYDFSNETLYIDDFKYGWRIIEPEENWTLIAHAIGFLTNNNVPPPKKIKFTIYQPKPYHPKGKIRSWEIDSNQLGLYYGRLIAILTNPNDTLSTGEHCHKCPSMTNCPASVKAGMNAIDVSETAYNDNINNNDLSFMLDTLTRASNVIKQTLDAYSELALHRVKQGQIVKNYSIDNQLSNQIWHDYVTKEIVFALTGKNIEKKNELITPTQALKLGIDETIVKSLSDRKIKGVKLIKIDENTKAQKLFKKDK